MATSYSVAEILDRIRRLGDYQNATEDYSETGTHMSSGTLLAFIDVAHRDAWRERADADEGWNLTRQTYTLTVGSASYALPSDHHKLRAVDLRVGDGWIPLRRANSDDDIVAEAQGEPEAYRLRGDWIDLIPRPDAADTLRLSYQPTAARISSSLQSIPGDDGFDQVVTLRTLIMARTREEKPFDDLTVQLNDMELKFRESVRTRDRAAPRRLRDPRSLSPYRRRRW